MALQLKPVKMSWFSSAGAASVAGHLAAIAVVLLFTGVKPFEPDSAKAITVDLVTPDEIKPPEAKKPPPDQKGATPQALPSPIAKPATDAQAAEPPKAQAAPAPTDQPDASQPPAPVDAATSDRKPQQQIAALPAAPEPPQPATPAYKPPEPDLSVKYGVMFGLPNADGNSDFDSAAVEKAEVSKIDIVAFRHHLKSCSTLPSSVAPSDDVSVKLRVVFTPDGRLAQEPILIAGTASAKGPALMKAAAAALEACAPYTMLPPDNYAQWKVLDLTFSPRDFNNG